MSKISINTILQVVRDAEQRRRKEQQANDGGLNAALSGTIDPLGMQSFAGKQFHEQCVRQAAGLTHLLENRLRNFDDVIHNSMRVSLGSEILIGLLKAAPPKPVAADKPELKPLLPKPLTFWQSLVPGASARHDALVRAAHDKFVKETVQYQEREQLRQLEWEATCAQVDVRNELLLSFVEELKAGVEASLKTFFELLLQVTPFFPEHTPEAKVGYSRDSKHLVIDYELPEISIIPDAAGFTYARARQQVQAKRTAQKDRKTRYANLISQLALAALSVTFRSGPAQVVECVTLNGFVHTTDPATGREIRPYLFSVRTTREIFEGLNLERVSPTDCLKALKANVSSSPDELLPIKPIFEISMVDPRFVQSGDVLSTLDRRPNLMDLSPAEFEELITNLFAKMGLETRMTQASRDGGVDCVAYDQRPILGGKVVIQAKRYKNTVGVSAVRDLYGTMQNEGASKGILVTTSGYGKAAFEFAAGKPLELLDGSNLLYLLEERADLRCKIVMPDDGPDYVPN
jgi:restriction system protein